MPQTEIKIPALFGGISQQPEHLRFSNQVQDSSNARYDVKDGINKRPGSIYVINVAGPTRGVDYRLHTINRDDDEKYIVAYGVNFLEAYHTDGTRAGITKTAAAATYMSGSTAANLRFTSLVDSTFISDSTTTLATDISGINFQVTDSFRDYEVMTSHLGIINAYYRTIEDSDIIPKGYFNYAIDTGDNGWAEWTRTADGPDVWRKPFAGWDNQSNNPMGFRMRIRLPTAVGITAADGFAFTASDRKLTKTGAFANYTTVTSIDEIFIDALGGTSLPTGWWIIESRTSDDAVVLSMQYRAAADNALLTHGTPVDKGDCDCDYISQEYAMNNVDFSSDGQPGTQPTMLDIALEIQKDIRESGGNSNETLVNWVESRASARGGFQVVSPFRGAGGTVVNFYSPDSGSGDFDLTLLGEGSRYRPFSFPRGTAAAGAGTPTNGVLRSPDDRWVQVAPPGQSDGAIDETTSPIRMTRTVIGPPAHFSVHTLDYTVRLSGDANTNPVPKLWDEGIPVKDITFYQGRLVFIGEQYVVMSQADDLFNFFSTDPGKIVDSDPINLEISGDGVSFLQRTIPFRKNLMFTTESSQQFELSFTDVLNQESAVVDQSTNVKTLDVAPTSFAGRIYLAGTDCAGGTVHEYAYDDFQVASVTNNIASHVDTLLPTNIQTIISDGTNRTLVACSGDSNILYVYAAFWDAQKKVQSAWTKYEFHTNYKILDITMVDDEVFMLVDDGVTFLIEKFSVSCGTTTLGTPPSVSGSGVIPLPSGFSGPSGLSGGGSVAVLWRGER